MNETKLNGRTSNPHSSPRSYWMTCATAYVPQNLINTLIYSAIVYHMAGLNGACASVPGRAGRSQSIRNESPCSKP